MRILQENSRQDQKNFYRAYSDVAGKIKKIDSIKDENDRADAQKQLRIATDALRKLLSYF